MTEPQALRRDVPLAPLTTLQVGGSSRFLVDAPGEREVVEALHWAKKRQLPVAVLGGGSNLLVADNGFPGMILRQGSCVIRIDRQAEKAEVFVSAGVVWDDFVAWAIDRGLAGIECLSGIPGEVGAAPIQNIGAYGQEVAEVIDSVVVVDSTTLEARRLDVAACQFSYRDSLFKSVEPGRYVITGVHFRLPVDGAATVRYPELQRALQGADAPPSLGAVREAVLKLRRGKSMVLEPGDPNRRSAGSFFLNPVVGGEEATEAAERAQRHAPGQNMPQYPAPGGRVKLSAAWLIERAGLPKGTVRGRVGLSSKHCLALINRGGATAQEIVDFAREIKETVRAAFGVSLTPEPRPLGFRPTELLDLYQPLGSQGDADSDLR